MRVIDRVTAPPAGLLLDEGVMGRQGAVRRARVEVQQLGPLAATNRHSTTTAGSRYGGAGGSRGEKGQISDIRPHRHGCARLGQHGGRLRDAVHTKEGGIPVQKEETQKSEPGTADGAHVSRRHQGAENCAPAICPTEIRSVVHTEQRLQIPPSLECLTFSTLLMAQIVSNSLDRGRSQGG